MLENILLPLEETSRQPAFKAAPSNTVRLFFALGLLTICFSSVGWAQPAAQAQDDGKTQSKESSHKEAIHAEPGLFKPLTEPPCSYCVDQNSKGFVKPDDVVLAWIRGAHNGGAFPLRYFISKSRVINDTYGLFFYDPDGGYVASFKKDYGYRFHGWRGGVMVVESEDGTLWSALTGRAFQGPQKGKVLERVPSMTTTWGHWLMLHPESTAYDLFDGKRYPPADLPNEISAKARESMGKADNRLEPFVNVIGVEGKESQIAFSLAGLEKRDVRQTELEDQSIVVFWYGPTNTAIAFNAEIDGRGLSFYADEISPETAPFKDRETGTRWTLAGRGIDGPLRGKELTWINSIQCRWYAWSFEYPETKVVAASQKN